MSQLFLKVYCICESPAHIIMALLQFYTKHTQFTHCEDYYSACQTNFLISSPALGVISNLRKYPWMCHSDVIWVILSWKGCVNNWECGVFKDMGVRHCVMSGKLGCCASPLPWQSVQATPLCSSCMSETELHPQGQGWIWTSQFRSHSPTKKDK